MSMFRILPVVFLLAAFAGAVPARIAVVDLTAKDAPVKGRERAISAFIGELTKQNDLAVVQPDEAQKAVEAKGLTLVMASPSDIGRSTGAQRVIFLSFSADAQVASLSYRVYDNTERKVLTSKTDSCGIAEKDIVMMSRMAAWVAMPHLGFGMTAEMAGLARDSIQAQYYAVIQTKRALLLDKQQARKKLNLKYGIITGSTGLVALGLAVAGKAFDSKANSKFNESEKFYDEYQSAVSGFDEKWDAALAADKDAKELLKKRDVFYYSAMGVGAVSLASLAIWQVKYYKAGTRLSWDGRNIQFCCTLGAW